MLFNKDLIQAARRVCNVSLFMNFDSTDHEETEEATLITRDQYILFNMEELITVTENFHDGNKLGEGRFGPVYKVTRLK